MFDEVIRKYNVIAHDVNGSSRPLRRAPFRETGTVVPFRRMPVLRYFRSVSYSRIFLILAAAWQLMPLPEEPQRPTAVALQLLLGPPHSNQGGHHGNAA
jgi:hypothetical protein